MKTIKFANGEVNISAVKIGVVVQDSQSEFDRYGHIVGFYSLRANAPFNAVVVKWQDFHLTINECPEYLNILL